MQSPILAATGKPPPFVQNYLTCLGIVSTLSSLMDDHPAGIATGRIFLSLGLNGSIVRFLRGSQKTSPIQLGGLAREFKVCESCNEAMSFASVDMVEVQGFSLTKK